MRRPVFYAYMPYQKQDGGPFLRAHGLYIYPSKEMAERVVRRMPGGRLFGEIVPVHIVPVKRR